MAPRSNIFSEYHVGFDEVGKSRKWFTEKIADIKRGRRVTANKVIASTTSTSQIVPGSLYFFYYDPKLKDTLPYYDAFPMVFPYKPAPGGFLGLNLHYLGYPERFALFKQLLEINGSKVTDATKLKYQWSTINSMSQVAKHCIKHYLNDHVVSQFSKIEPEDWTTAMFMPVEKFIGESKEYVWNQNRK